MGENFPAALATPDQIRSLLNDALFDCYRARHDAIDAGTSKIALDLDAMTSRLGYEVIMPIYPDFPKLFNALQSVRSQIAKSRKDRDNREAIYSTLEATDFPALVAQFNELRQNEHMMLAMARRRRWSEAIGIGGFAVGVIAVALAVYFWLHP